MSTTKKIFLIIVLFTFILGFNGCSGSAQKYQASRINVEKLQQLDKNINVVISPKSIDDYSASTRMTSVETPDEEPFVDYIHHAFNLELKLARKYSIKKPNIVLTMELEDIELYTRFGNARWEFKMKISSSNGDSFTKEYEYKFDSLHSSEFGSYDAAYAFKHAIQGLIRSIIYDDKFDDLLNKNS